MTVHEAERNHRLVRTVVNPSWDYGGKCSRCGRCACWIVSMGYINHKPCRRVCSWKYFGSIRAPAQVYDQVLEFLMRNYGRKLREVMDAEIDISDVIQ